MDKNAIKTFAIESRNKLIADVEYQMNILGISSKGIDEPTNKAEGMESYILNGVENIIYDKQIQQRESLVKVVKSKGYENVIEEVAYTWFNRIIAIRYMEVNDYLPTRTRVLSSETEGKIEPDIITEAFDLDLDYTDEDRETIFKLKDENKLDELFKLLFIKQCNKLNEVLPGLFEKTDEYMELLLNISFTDEEGIVRQLIKSISEKDFDNQVEIIGWLYQFYNSELKDETFTNLKKGIKISKERIPAVTQLFTPDWIVKYMVENSIGRLWLEGHKNDELKSKWKYFIDEEKQKEDVQLKLEDIICDSKKLKPEDLKVIDPCMGSGHILVYVFDVLMQIYTSEGYTEKDATELILKHNIYGLDIDDRAYQLSYFAVLMKARKYHRTIFSKNIVPLIFSIQESNNLSKEFCEELISFDRSIYEDLNYLISVFDNAKEYGCILNVKQLDFNKLFNIINKFKMTKGKLINEIYIDELNLLKRLLYQALILSTEYDSVITNPPYMSNRGMDSKLNNYLKKYYPNSKSDLSTVFFEKSFNLSKNYGFVAMINIPVWMFISSYNKLREDIINKKQFINMLHLGRGIFGSDFGTTSFVIRNSFIEGFNSIFRQLYLDKGAVDSVTQKESWFFDSNFNKFVINQELFKNIPGNPIAYWVSNNFINNYKKFDCLGNIIDIKQGLATGNNKQFLRYWFEVDFDKIGFNYQSTAEFHESLKKYAPYNKGGEFKKWYGNCEFVIKFDKKNYNILLNQGNHLPSRQYYFKDGITWTLVSSKSSFAARISNEGFVFDVGGSSGFTKNDIYPFLGFLCSNVAYEYLSVLNPTINVQVGDLKNLPFSDNIINNELINLVKDNVDISKRNWDLYEVSWNFKSHPFLKYDLNNLKDIFTEYQKSMDEDFALIKNKEEQINKLIIDYYNLNELSYKVEDKDITLKVSNIKSDIKSFISYAVGCILGRYSLDEEGLIYAGGKFDIDRYSKFIPDQDNIIPILDTAYFEDDIVSKFIEFLKIIFGEDTLEENIDFIAEALTNKGNTSREKIRNYFIKDFFKEHIKTYKKCPIYWEFNSGKENGFKCLVYMHRYNPDLVGNVRTGYLHETQRKLDQAIKNCENIIETTSSKSEKTKATKEKNKLIKQLKETKEYDEALAHIANQRIEINLDDGVKVNYAKFQNVEVSKEGSKTKKINLLTKI